MRRHGTAEAAAGIVAALALIGASVGIGVATVNSRADKECTVTAKDRTRGSDGQSDMRVYTHECGVLKVEDSILAGQWSSADTFAQIEENKTYTFTVQGWRVPLFSIFPNIIDVKPAS